MERAEADDPRAGAHAALLSQRSPGRHPSRFDRTSIVIAIAPPSGAPHVAIGADPTTPSSACRTFDGKPGPARTTGFVPGASVTASLPAISAGADGACTCTVAT